MIGTLSMLIYTRGRVRFTCFLWWRRLQLHDERAAVLCGSPGNNRAPSAASEAVLLGFVQRGAAMQMEMGSIELTQDIIACQSAVAFL